MDYDPEERCSDEEYAEAYQEYLWAKEQDERDLPPHKRGDYLERQLEQADMLRKALREM